MFSARSAVPFEPKILNKIPSRLSKHSLSVDVLALVFKSLDLAILGISGFADSRICSAWGLRCSGGEWTITGLATTFAALFVLYQSGVYQPNQLGRLGLRVPTILVATSLGCLLGLAVCAMMPVVTPALRVWPLLWLPSATLLLLVGDLSMIACLKWLVTTERLTRRVAILGQNAYGVDLALRINEDPKRTATVIGFYDGEVVGSARESSHFRGCIDNLVEDARAGLVDAVVITPPLLSLDQLSKATAALSSVNIDIFLAGPVLELARKAGYIDLIGDVPVLKIGRSPLRDLDLLKKDIFDRAIAAILLVIGLPFLLLVASAIKITSTGPALFRQPRTGFNNTMFDIYKFRTMYHDCEDVRVDRQVTRGDPRVTPLGRILRRTSIDEMPQLLNVLRGEMSLVGPRPHAPDTKAGDHLFQNVVSDYAMRHRVKPGITGWAQVNGWRGETRTRTEIENRVQHDLYYIDNWSLLLDVRILILTAIRELNSKVAF